MALTCAFYHTDRKTGNLVVMRTVGFIINHNEGTIAGRVWSHEMKQPLGQSSVTISEEHLDHCWFTEEDVRKAALYNEAGSQEPFTMLLAKLLLWWWEPGAQTVDWLWPGIHGTRESLNQISNITTSVFRPIQTRQNNWPTSLCLEQTPSPTSNTRVYSLQSFLSHLQSN